jgi:hypothetical protein
LVSFQGAALCHIENKEPESDSDELLLDDQMTPNAPDSDLPDEQMSEAAIDRTLADSFPASDPPSWTLGVKKSRKKRSPEHPLPPTKRMSRRN